MLGSGLPSSLVVAFGMVDGTPPSSNEIAEALWQLAGSGAPLGDLLSCAKEVAGGNMLLVIQAFTNAFDIPLSEAKHLVGTWEGFVTQHPGFSSDEVEKEHGVGVRSLRRPRPRQVRWSRHPEGAWRGVVDDEST